MNATIQAQAEYRSRFGNFRYKIQIVDSDQESENIRLYNITPEGAVIEYEASDENVFQPIIPSTCRFTLVCQTLAEVAFLRRVARSESGRYGVRVLRADNNDTPSLVHWVGTLISDQFTFSDRLPLHVDLIASDDLGYLKEEPYTDSNGERFVGSATVTEHILNCLNLLRTKWHWGYFVTILGTDFYNGMLQYSDDIRSLTFNNSGTTDNIFDFTKIRHMAFYTDDEHRVENAYNVLKDILLFFNCQLHFTYDTNLHSFLVRPFGSYQKFANDGTAVQNGKFVRANNVAFTAYQKNLSTLDIGSTSSNDRLKGGTFSYLQPYKKVTRKNNLEDTPTALFSKGFQEEQQGTLLNGITMSDGNENASVYKFGQIYTLPSLSGFEEGEQFRLRINLHTYFNASAAADYPALVHSTATGFTGTMPEAFNIFRLRLKIQFRLSNTDGNDHYLKRALTQGGQAPVYADFDGFSTTPQYYTDQYAINEASWDTAGSQQEVFIISAPFDGNASQSISFSEDIVTPAIGTITHEGTKIKIDIDLIAHDGTVLSVASSSNNYLFEDSHNHNPTAQIRVVPFEGYASENLQTFTSVNDIDARKTLQAESPKHIGDFANMFGSPRYLHSGGSYEIEGSTGGYVSQNESTTTFPAAKLCAEEIAAYYSRHREKYDGTLIKVVPSFSTIITYDNSLVGGGTDTIKSKIQKLRYVSGIEEAHVTLVELDRDKHLTSIDSNVVRDDDGGYVPPPEPPAPPTTGLENALISNMGVVVAPSVDVTSAAVARNRSSQTGQQLAAIDANGVLQEITDGSNGHILSTNGSGVYSFGAQSFIYMLSSGSFLGSLGREDNFYFGSTLYGFNSFSWNSAISSASSIDDEYASNGIVVPYALTRLIFKSTIRNSSNARDIDVTIAKGSRPNGSSSDITLTSLGTGTANNDAGVSLHYNCDIDMTSISVAAGDLIFILFKRADGGNVTTNVNVSYSLLAIT
jgi:hypothetical protein